MKVAVGGGIPDDRTRFCTPLNIKEMRLWGEVPLDQVIAIDNEAEERLP